MQILIGRLNGSRPIKDFNVGCSSGDLDDQVAEWQLNKVLTVCSKSQRKNCQGPVSGNPLLCAMNLILTIKYE